MNIILSSIGALKNTKESARITLFLIAKELQRQGHHIRIVAKGQGEEEIEGIGVHRTSLIKMPFLLRKLHRKKKIEVIHSFSSSALFFALHLFGPGKKIHSFKSYSRSLWGRIGYSLLLFAKAVTIPTSHFARGIPFKGNIHIVHSPIDTAKFHPQDQVDLKKKYHYENHKIVLYYGALWDNKGVGFLIDSISQVIKRIPQVKFLFLPRYTKIDAQQQQVRRLGMEKYVEFITQDVSIQDYVSLADVVVLPYKNLIGTEGNPSCMLEAMACKTAVITSNLPELREIAPESVEFFEAGNKEELIDTIVAVLTQKNVRKIEKAYQTAQQFDHIKIARNYLNLYEQ